MQRRCPLLSCLGGLLAVVVLVSSGIAPRAAAAQAKPTVTTFYSTTQSAYKTWVAATLRVRPKNTTHFPCPTTTVAFYFEYANAVPKHTQIQILVYLHTGNGQDDKNEAQSSPLTLSYINGRAMRTVTDHYYPANPGFSGPYRAILLIDGHRTVRTDFTSPDICES